MRLTEKLLELSVFFDSMAVQESQSDETYADIVEMIKNITHSERSSFFILNEQSNTLQTKPTPDLLMTICVDIGQGVVGRCAQIKELIMEVDVDASRHFNSSVDVESGFITRNMISVPILTAESKVLGVLQVLNKIEGEYDATDVTLLRKIASLLVPYMSLA